MPKFSSMNEDNVEEFINEIRIIKKDFYALQNRIEELHGDHNCSCEQDKDLGTFYIEPEGAGEIQVCLQCFGAIGVVY